MRRIIKGKAYDTSKARFIAEYENMDYPSNFYYTSESLYQKKTGEYFLYCTGGQRSKYWFIQIIPLTVEETKEWVEEHANSMYEELFGICEE